MRISKFDAVPVGGHMLKGFELQGRHLLTHEDEYIRGLLEKVAKDWKLECLETSEKGLRYARPASLFGLVPAQSTEYAIDRSAADTMAYMRCVLPDKRAVYILEQLSEQLNLEFSPEAGRTFSETVRRYRIKA